MPSVSDIMTTIKDLALVGSGSTSDDARILRYMNLVYGDLYRKTASAYPTLLQETETVTITSGSGSLTKNPHYVVRVKDTGNNSNPIYPTSIDKIEDKDPDISAAGTPTSFYVQGEKTLKTWPINSTTVSVRYIPSFTPLDSADAEADIKIPVEFHDILVWGTLVYMAHDERDKAVMGEIQVAQSKYEIGIAEFQVWLARGQVGDELVTERTIGA